MSSRDDLIRHIASLRSSKSDIGNLPQQVEDWHGNLVKAIRTGEIISAISSIGISVFVNEAFVIEKVWDNRDKINRALGTTWQKLNEMDPGLEVPVKFLDHADEWKNVQGDIVEAGNRFRTAQLIGVWKGDAADRYRVLHGVQSAAFPGMKDMCGEVAKNLQDVAAAELTLYSDLVSKSHDLIEKVTSLTGSYLSSLGSMPFGPLSASSNLVSATEASNTFIVGIINSTAANAFAITKAANDIAQAQSVQDGIPYNKWPPAVIAAFGEGKQGVTAALGDASTRDGDKSDWQL